MVTRKTSEGTFAVDFTPKSGTPGTRKSRQSNIEPGVTAFVAGGYAKIGYTPNGSSGNGKQVGIIQLIRPLRGDIAGYPDNNPKRTTANALGTFRSETNDHLYGWAIDKQRKNIQDENIKSNPGASLVYGYYKSADNAICAVGENATLYDTPSEPLPIVEKRDGTFKAQVTGETRFVNYIVDLTTGKIMDEGVSWGYEVVKGSPGTTFATGVEEERLSQNSEHREAIEFYLKQGEFSDSQISSLFPAPGDGGQGTDGAPKIDGAPKTDGAPSTESAPSGD